MLQSFLTLSFVVCLVLVLKISYIIVEELLSKGARTIFRGANLQQSGIKNAHGLRYCSSHTFVLKVAPYKFKIVCSHISLGNKGMRELVDDFKVCVQQNKLRITE